MFKKIIASVSALTLIAASFVGCSSASANDDGKLSVVCTIFPVYDWTREIVGSSDDVQLTYLMNSGADLHNYQPTADDMITISDCDVFVYVGGESDKWVDGALSEARNKDMVVIDLMDILDDSDLREEELKEGMEAVEEEEEGEEDEIEYDEHIWLSVRNAVKCTEAIAEKLEAADPDKADTFKSNTESYVEKLNKLDADFSEMTSNAKTKTLIFGDRFPFRYFVDDYGLDYYAAFIGCSAETEASFETIAFLADKADELGAENIFTIEGSDCTIAEAIVSNTKSKNQKIVTLDSIQSVAKADIGAKGYYSIMSENYNILKEALN